MNAWLADVVLIIHFAFVAFIVGGLALIWTGALAGWKWVRNFRFRVAHLAAIGCVALEALIGMWCPLTVWEAALRGREADKSFLAHWMHRLLFHDWPEWIFTTLHIGFALLVAATWLIVRPAKK